MAASAEMSSLMRAFVSKLNQVPMALRQEGPIVSCYELGKTILGRGYPEATGLDDIVSTQIESVLTQGTPAEYKNPTFLKNMKMIEDAITKRDELLAERNKWPSFKLNIPGLDGEIRDPVEEVIAELSNEIPDHNEGSLGNCNVSNSAVPLGGVEVKYSSCVYLYLVVDMFNKLVLLSI